MAEEGMKNCPQCGEEIKVSAIKCRHCGSVLDEKAHQAATGGAGSKSKEDLRAIAKYQRGIIVCILLYVLAAVGQVAIPPNLRPFVGLMIIPVLVAACVFVFLLSLRVYSTAVGIIMAILTLVPCLGLIALLIINSTATATLKANGISVGIAGADPSQI